MYTEYTVCIHVRECVCLCALLAALGVWLRILPIGEFPSSRDGHACAVIGADMFIHGGFAATVSCIGVN